MSTPSVPGRTPKTPKSIATPMNVNGSSIIGMFWNCTKKYTNIIIVSCVHQRANGGKFVLPWMGQGERFRFFEKPLK